MTWFEVLTGFRETLPSQVRQNITVDGETLTSHVNGKVMVCGRLETPSLAELRERVRLTLYLYHISALYVKQKISFYGILLDNRYFIT